VSEHSISTINRIVVGGVAAVVTLSAWTALKVNDLDKSSGIFAIRLENTYLKVLKANTLTRRAGC